jgi:predicted ribosomally synthesized peptide with SipW-like signal peptide
VGRLESTRLRPAMWLPTLERGARASNAVAVAVLVGLVSATCAWAAFTSTKSATGSVAAGSLAAPTGLTAACVSLSSNVTLSWTATTSTIATGYAILRATTTGGPYSQIGTVSGRTTTTFTDTIGALQTRYWVVEATRNSWTSPNSNQAGLQSVSLGVCNSV